MNNYFWSDELVIKRFDSLPHDLYHFLLILLHQICMYIDESGKGLLQRELIVTTSKSDKQHKMPCDNLRIQLLSPL